MIVHVSLHNCTCIIATNVGRKAYQVIKEVYNLEEQADEVLVVAAVAPFVVEAAAEMASPSSLIGIVVEVVGEEEGCCMYRALQTSSRFRWTGNTAVAAELVVVFGTYYIEVGSAWMVAAS